MPNQLPRSPKREYGPRLGKTVAELTGDITFSRCRYTGDK
jgi:hypothetical protein